MTNFRDFWQETKEVSTNLESSLSIPSSSGLSNSILTSVTAISMAGVNTSSEEAKKFGREVAQCATSDEVISAISNGVGEPKPYETEEEFVKRASNVLRRILREKFNV